MGLSLNWIVTYACVVWQLHFQQMKISFQFLLWFSCPLLEHWRRKVGRTLLYWSLNHKCRKLTWRNRHLVHEYVFFSTTILFLATFCRSIVGLLQTHNFPGFRRDRVLPFFPQQELRLLIFSFCNVDFYCNTISSVG